MVDNIPNSNHLDSETANQEQFSDMENIPVEVMQKNPLENPLIIDKVFDFLDLSMMKQCRMVCKKWNELSIRHMEKMSTVVLNDQTKAVTFQNSFPATETDWESSSISRLSFQAFLLNSKWSPSTLEGFLESQRQNIRELNFQRLRVYKEGPRLLPYYYSISPHIDNRLTHFTIDFSNVTVSVDKLTSANYLSLRRCRMDVVRDCKLAPMDLKMHDVALFRDKVKVTNFLMNDILSFENLKHLDLCNYHRNRGSSYSVNMSSNVTVENLILVNVEIENFEGSNWKITGKVQLTGVPFERYNKLEFSELEFGGASLNLNVLPKSIERLTLGMDYRIMKIVGSAMPNLPNLKYLFIGAGECPLSSLEMFSQCKNLSTLILRTRPCLRYQTLNTGWIPPSVKKLVICGTVRVNGNEIKVEKVLVQKFRMESLLDTLRKLKSNHLILDLHFIDDSVQPLKVIEDTILAAIEMPYDSVAMGNFQTTDEAFDESKISKFVDNKAGQYIFKNKTGKSISPEEFMEIMEAGQQI